MITRDWWIPFFELDFSYARSSGPGGQNVNKVNSKALLRWNALASAHLPEPYRARFLAKFGNKLNAEGELLIVSERFRDQKSNREDCVDKLRSMLLQVSVAPKIRKPTKPTRASRAKRKDTKRRQSEKKKIRRQRSFD